MTILTKYLYRFGSVVVDDAERMTSWYLYFSHLQSLTAGGRRFVSETIFSALATTPPIRALVSAGWGGLGGTEIPENVFILGNVPHDWLFSRVSDLINSKIYREGFSDFIL